VPVALILLVGYGTANIFFWNRPLALSLGHPTFPLVVTTLAGVGKVTLSFLLVPQLTGLSKIADGASHLPRYGMYIQAVLMSIYFVVSIGLIVWRGLSEIQRQSRLAKESL
jgi:hypothetical protein